MSDPFDDDTDTPWPPVDPDPDIDRLYQVGEAGRTLSLPTISPTFLLSVGVGALALTARLVAQAIVPGTSALPLLLLAPLSLALGILAAGLSDRLGIMKAASIAGFVALALGVGEHALYVLPALCVLAGAFIGRVRSV